MFSLAFRTFFAILKSISAATLSLDFTTGSLDSKITFNRSTTGTYVGSNGLIQTAAVDVPRFDYDPSTLAIRGLLVEDARTNVILQSQAFSTSPWITGSATITLNSVTAPDGTMTGTTFTSTSASSWTYQPFTTAAAASIYSASVYAKAGTTSAFTLYLYSNTGPAGIRATFDLSAGTVGEILTYGGAGNQNAYIENAGNGWYKCTIVTACASSTSYYPQPTLLTSGVTVYLWGMQVEVGDTSSSYIPTTTTAASRGIDIAEVNSISSFYNSEASTLFFQGIPTATLLSPLQNCVALHDKSYTGPLSNGAFQNRMNLARYYFGAGIGVVTAQGTNTLLDIEPIWPAFTLGKIAMSNTRNKQLSCCNGTTSGSNTAAAIPNAATTLTIGSRPVDNLFAWRGRVQKVDYYNTALNEAQLKALTGGWVESDPYWSNVSLLLQADGPANARNNNTFLDGSANALAVTRNGNVTQGSISPFIKTYPYNANLGGGSMYFDGTGDYLQTTLASSLPGMFTIEMWVYRTTSATSKAVFTIGDSGTANNGFELYYSGANFSLYGLSAYQITTTNAPAVGQWSHVAVTRDASNVVRFYLNGTQIGSTWTTTTTFSDTIRIGCEYYNATITPTAYFDGYISNFRVVKDVVVYASNFTPPILPLTKTQVANAVSNIAGIIEVVTPTATASTVDYLVVAGGGGGGGSLAGGGGGGGLLAGSNLVVSTGTPITVTVGAGGLKGTGQGSHGSNGGSSTFSSITTVGGGGGGAYNGYTLTGNDGNVGGSGGGAGSSEVAQTHNGGAGTSGQGYAGGSTLGRNTYNSGGGGGAGGAGSPGVAAGGGFGGVGLASSITGTSTYYAGGGGGAGYGDIAGQVGGVGGLGGGANGSSATNSVGANGTANTGGGGGGSGYVTTSGSGGTGGTGVVIIRHLSTDPLATTTGSPVVTTSGGYRIYTFNASGTIQFGTSLTPTTIPFSLESLVVAGGGGGGMDMGGGGGGGGVLYSSNTPVNLGGIYKVTVGAGGYGAPAGSGGYRTDGVGPQPSVHAFTISATNGGNSSFSTITAIGGGYGGSSYYGYTPNNGYGNTGGSGGGASGYSDTSGGHGGAGTAGQGNAGGSGGGQYYSGGGGGAGAVGASGSNQPNGGAGILYPISPYYFGGGGGGSAYTSSTGGNGGIGGGGGGAVGTTTGGAGINNGSGGGGGSPNSQTNTPGGNAGANTGGGGGGGSHYSANNKGGEGGSGVVILRHLDSFPLATTTGSPTVVTSGGYRTYTFTTSGTISFGTSPTGLLLNGVNAAIVDTTGNNVLETVGDAQISTSVRQYGTGSLKFDGTGDYLTMPASANTSFGTGDFTVEFWMNTAGANSQMLSLASGTALGNWQCSLYNGNFYWQSARNTTDVLYVASASITNSLWHHVAITRATNTLRIFFDGVQQGSVTDGTNYNVTSVLNIGYSSTYFNGYLDDVRITKGIARYTMTFTPPVSTLPFIPRAADAAATPVNNLNKSLRFRASASAYLNRTFGTPTSATTWTWSGWVKFGLIGSAQYTIFSGDSSTTNYGILNIGAVGANTLDFVNRPSGGQNARLTTNQVFRDTSIWYHIVLVWDTSNAISTDRLRLYINGVQITSFSTATYPAQNTVSIVNSAIAHELGAYVGAGGGYGGGFDGEMAEINFVDGQALAPTAFGGFSTYDQWMPKAYTGTYGTNGFYLPFTNTTSTSTLVADSSGNGNNWTPNNISLTAGTTYDSFTDVPTRTSVTAGNYAVLLQAASYMGGQSTITDGNLNYLSPNPSSNYAVSGVRASIPFASGKFYWEARITLAPGANGGYNIGVTDTAATINTGAGFNNGYLWGYNVLNGAVYVNGSVVTTVTTSTLNDIIGLAFDRTAGTMSVYKNNTLLSTQTGTPSGAGGTWVPSMTIDQGYNDGRQIGFNYTFGQRPFTYTPPTNFLALNSYNASTIPMLFPAAPSIMPPAVETLVVAGGGGGGYQIGGGGGAGGLVHTGSYAIATGSSYTATVGAGGATNSSASYLVAYNGNDSIFGTMMAHGGGGGGANGGGGSPTVGGTGASGGSNGGNGEGTYLNTVKAVASQGNSGGTAYDAAGGVYGSGGGGGAAAVGGSGTSSVGGNGGNGLAYSISGISTYYAGGGGGGTYYSGGGSGGSGGGGAAGTQSGINGVAGISNTGGGGGGGTYNGSSGAGATGGSGIVIIRYLDSYLPASATTGSPIYTVANGYRVYKFTGSGTITF